jgi:uncharacterized protein (DUF2235 family)
MALYAFDGTWNTARLHDDEESANETNVANFAEAYTGPTWYIPGPGTRFGKVGHIIGGVTGAGGRERVDEAYKQLCQNWEAGDTTIDVVGFSRGAAIALDFVNRVEDNGIRRPGSRQVVEGNPTVRFLGLWDTVGAFGVPFNLGFIPTQKINLGHKLRLTDSIDYCFHAMAMDERRQTFRITRLLNAYEVWFRGVHSDIGGGNGNTALSTIPLRWMLRKAIAVGLPIADGYIASHDARINVDAPLHPPRDYIPNEYRGFLQGDRFHYTVSERADHHNAPADGLREAEQDETVSQRIADLQARNID